MSLHADIKNQMKEAMKAKDANRLQTLRNLLAAFTNELIAQKSNEPELSDQDAIALIKRSVKQRKDSIEQFTKGGRIDLVEAEAAELKVLEQYLPQTMSREEIQKVVITKKTELGITDKAKIGQLTGIIMKELKGKADGGDVKAVVEELFA